MSWLLDTNVISEAARLRPNPGVSAWFARYVAGEQRMFVSAASLGEILLGILALPTHDPARSRLVNWAERDVSGRFLGRILAFDGAVAATWATMSASLPRGYKQPVFDSIIAATALHHDLVLVTRDTQDFRRVPGLKLESPFA
jgi:hypothetical protein